MKKASQAAECIPEISNSSRGIILRNRMFEIHGNLEMAVEEFAHAFHESAFLRFLLLLFLNPKLFPQFLHLLLPIEPVVVESLQHDFFRPVLVLLVVAVAVGILVAAVAEVVVVVVVQPHPPPGDPTAGDRLLEVTVLAGGEDHVVAEGDRVVLPHRVVEFEVVAAGALGSDVEAAVDRTEGELRHRHGGDDGGGVGLRLRGGGFDIRFGNDRLAGEAERGVGVGDGERDSGIGRFVDLRRSAGERDGEQAEERGGDGGGAELRHGGSCW